MTIYLGENIKRLRREKEITQETLADFLGVTFQSVSRWERNEGYPDITTLPVIARFFNISVDELLGVNKAENEEEIKKLLKEHDNLTDEKLIWEAINNLIEKYPNDFRVQLRYMGYFVFYNKIADNKAKILSIYENIQKNCTVDSIRICAKRYYIHYLELLAHTKDSGVTFEECEKIIKEMPRMRDGQEMYCFNYKIHGRENYVQKIQETIEEELFLLYSTLSDYFFCSEHFTREYQVEILEQMKNLFNFFYDDGNYSRMWRIVANQCYGIQGWFCFELGDKKKAMENFKKSAELAAEFDSLDKVTTMHSTLFEGKSFDKSTLGSTFVAKSWMKELLTEKYPLSDEFKSTDEFKEILKILE